MATADEEYVRQLREVFDLCDEYKVGFISVDQIRHIVKKDFGGSDEDIRQLIECLDPNNHGVVTFSDFSAAALRKKTSPLKSKQNLVWDCAEENGTVDRDRLTSTPIPVVVFGEEDSAIATGSDVSRDSLREEKRHNPSDGDENYICLGHQTKSDLNSSGSFRSNSSAGSNSGGNRRRRSSRMLHRSGSKRMSTAAVSNQLRHNGSRNSSRRNSASSEEMFPLGPMSLETDVNDLNEKVQELQQQVATLTDHQASTDERYTKVKQENAVLQNKIHCLEEQLKELEFRSEDRLKAEQKQFKEIMARHERENKQEMEQYANRLFALQQECMQLSEEKVKLQAQVEKLKQEKQLIEDKLMGTQSELLNIQEDHHRLQEAIRRERAEFSVERSNNHRILEELTKELENFQQCKMDLRARSPSLLELPSQYRELEQELKKIKDENKQILETNEELHAQLLSSSLREGRSLLHQQSASLADEFETLTKDEITTALREQKEVNAKLRAYIDGILLNILENHPQLLEVKTNM